MAIKGSLREASLPDVLQLLAMGQKTGCLSVTDRTNFGYIYFDRGRIAYASIVNRPDRLGDLLVKSGAIGREALDSAIALQSRQRDRRLGEILIEQKALTRDALHRVIRVQIEEAVYFLFTWSQGTFSFDGDVRPDERELLVSIPPETLLLEGARRVDEWSLIEKKVPSLDIIFDVDRTHLAASGVQLTREQEQIVQLIDGHRDVNDLVDASGLGEFDVGKALYGLATAGFLHRIGKSKPALERTLAVEARVAEHRNLGVAFYRTAMLDEATREFRRSLELSPADVQSRFFLSLIAMREGKWEESVSLLRDAATQADAHAAVVHNLAYALERLGKLDQAKTLLAQAVRHRGGDDPRIRSSVGVLALKMGLAQTADALLAAARTACGTRTPAAAWFHYASLAAALAGDADRALALAQEGVAVHPHSAPLLNTLAVLHEQLGDYESAIQAAERGLREDSRLPQLHKNVGDSLYRIGRFGEAQQAYQRAITLNPTLGADVYFKLGNIRYKRQEREAAIGYWERALELDPSNELIRTNLDLVRAITA